jgi:electron transfer flavoprotein beta subunit
MGADEAILLCDKAFSGADTSATSYTLSRAINKIEEFDLILCGRQAMDGNTAQVGPQIAELLKLPQITYVRDIEISGSTLKARRALEDGYQVLETGLPALLTVTKDINSPRIPPIDAIMDSYSKEINVWTAEDLSVDKALIGLKGSPTKIKRTFTPKSDRGQVVIIKGDAEEAAQLLVTKLKEKLLL